MLTVLTPSSLTRRTIYTCDFTGQDLLYSPVQSECILSFTFYPSKHDNPKLEYPVSLSLPNGLSA